MRVTENLSEISARYFRYSMANPVIFDPEQRCWGYYHDAILQDISGVSKHVL